MEDRQLKFIVETDEKYLGEVVGALNRFGALIQDMGKAEQASKIVQYNMTMADNYRFESWLATKENIIASISRVD